MIADKFTRLGLAAGTNVVIAAPGVGLSIFVQTITHGEAPAAGFVGVWGVQGVGGPFFAEACLPGANQSLSITFPGGLKLGSNNSCVCINLGGSSNVTVTYTIGPA